MGCEFLAMSSCYMSCYILISCCFAYASNALLYGIHRYGRAHLYEYMKQDGSSWLMGSSHRKLAGQNWDFICLVLPFRTTFHFC